MTDNPQYNRETCYFCHEQDTHILEEHHIVPRRYNGNDTPDNMVTVCPNCHRRLERLYDVTFYNSLGVEAPDGDVEDADDKPHHPTLGGGDSDEPEITYKDLTARLEDEEPGGAPIERIVDVAVNKYGETEYDVYQALEELRTKGDVYEPQTDHLRTVNT